MVSLLAVLTAFLVPWFLRAEVQFHANDWKFLVAGQSFRVGGKLAPTKADTILLSHDHEGTMEIKSNNTMIEASEVIPEVPTITIDEFAALVAAGFADETPQCTTRPSAKP
ncbi:MAG: hypothetical protein ABL995_07805 [Bryobacteraceae bacterium]